MALTSKIDTSGLKLAQIANQIDSDKVGLFASKEAKRLFDPYTPQRDKFLVRNVTYTPWKITYNQPYAEYVYNGNDMNFRTDKAQYASAEWDKAALNAGQDTKLSNAIGAFIKTQIGG